MGTCSACHAHVTPKRRNPVWFLVAAIAAPVVLVSFMFLAIMQPIGIFAAPLYFAFLTFPMVGLAEKLQEKPRCPKCRRIFVDAERASVGVAPIAVEGRSARSTA